MYTEENEFDYNDYLDDDENYDNNNKKSFLNKETIIKIIAIVLILLIVIFIVFTFKNRNLKKESNELVNNSDIVFNSNINLLREKAEVYFFKLEHYPKEEQETISITINDLIDQEIIKEVKDYDNKTCNYNSSYLSMTKNKNDYLLEIFLSCPSMEDKFVFYYDLSFNCLTCNGEAYISNENEEDNIEDTNTNQEETETNTNNNNPTNVCGTFGDWTTEYLADSNLEKEERVLVIGFKENITYGEWSNQTENVITPTADLEVKTINSNKTVTTTTDWSSKSTKKPASKEGREIKTSTKKESYTTYTYEEKTYTQERTTWDTNATYCVSKGIGKVTCTYVKKEKTPHTNYKTITYYQYRDTIEETVPTTYYMSRAIYHNAPSYTDYILESEMPSGYQKLPNSEIVQYRYREKCAK